MLKSMTGYGRGESKNQNRTFVVEIKSVNHRYNEINIRIPAKLNVFEQKVRNMVSKIISRGKIDIYIKYETFSENDINISVNTPFVSSFLKALNELKDSYALKSDLTAEYLAAIPEALIIKDHISEDDIEGVETLLFEALEEALAEILVMKRTEGLELKNDILEKTINVENYCSHIKNHGELAEEAYTRRLTKKLEDVLGNTGFDEMRMLTEVAILCDKTSIDEELTRLYSHIRQLRLILEEEGSIGKKLDFLIQEINREVNTIGSKANSIEITKSVISIKCEIEKIREQVQNIE